MACFPGESDCSGRSVGSSGVVESAGYAEENSGETGPMDRFAIRACSERFSRMGLSRSAVLCRGNFFISKSWKGSSCGLKRFWAISLISRVERAGQPFSVVAAWRPFKRAKPAAWDPPPRFPIWACFERFSPEDILRFWISRTRSGSVFSRSS